MKKNVFYFLKHYGDVAFEDFSFNEVDSLIMAQLSYLNFHDFAPSLSDNMTLSLSEIVCDDFVKYKICENTLDERLNRKLIDYIKTSKRYQDMKIGYVSDQFSDRKDKQFFSLTFVFKNFIYIAFRGTDPTLIGWKEDCQMSFMDIVPAQEEAKKYVEIVSEILKPLPIIIGGHSKGGNLAYYAAVMADIKIHERIIQIYNHDGPGFKSEKFFESESFKNLESKMIKMIPDDPMVGILMHNGFNFRIIKCYKFSVLKHDLYNWQVNKDGNLRMVKQIAKRAELFNRVVNEWINSISEEDRKEFVDILFDLIGAKSSIGIFDIKKHPFIFIRMFHHNLKQLPEQKRKFLKETLFKYRLIEKRLKKEMV